MRSMLSLMAGLANGYVEGNDKLYERDRQARMDQIRLDQASRDKTAWDQQQAERQSVIDAAAPVAATPDMVPVPAGEAPQQRTVIPASMDSRDVGLPGEAAPAPSMTVAGQSGLTPPQAASAVAAANSPAGVQQRQITALQATNPVRAASMEASVNAATRDKLALATEQWNNDVDTARGKGLDAILKLTDDSHADGQGGAVKSKAIISPDGQTFTIATVNPDGSTTGTGMPPLPNNQEGVDRLALALQRGVSPQARIAHYDQVAYQKGQLADKDADNKRADRLADSTIRYQERMADAANTKADAADTKANGSGKSMVDRMPEKDSIAYKAALKDVDETQKAITKAKADGSWDPDTNKGHKSLVTDLAAAKTKVLQLESTYSDGKGSIDPFPGVRKPAGPPSPSQVPAATQAQRDEDAGLLMVRSEYGGDLDRATSALAQLDAQAAKSTGDTKAIIAGDADRLRRGIDAAKRQASPSKPAASATVIAPKMATVAQSSPADIPDPPPHFIGRNGMPDRTDAQYKAWEATYGAAYAEKQRQEDAAAQAAAGAARAAVDARRDAASRMSRGNV